MKASVVILSYNEPQVLALALYSFLRQSETDFEVLVADDGSREDTWKMIEKFQKLYGKRLTHQWQDDHGTRTARILNRSLGVAKSDFVIVVDENSFAHRHFVRDHLRASLQWDLFLGARRGIGPVFSELVVENPTKIEGFEFWRQSLFSAKFEPLSSYNLSANRQWIERVGGFQEGLLGVKAELRDFYARMQTEGARIGESDRKAMLWFLQNFLRGTADLCPSSCGMSL